MRSMKIIESTTEDGVTFRWPEGFYGNGGPYVEYGFKRPGKDWEPVDVIGIDVMDREYSLRGLYAIILDHPEITAGRIFEAERW